jgi:hypothetical protein
VSVHSWADACGVIGSTRRELPETPDHLNCEASAWHKTIARVVIVRRAIAGSTSVAGTGGRAQMSVSSSR